MHTVRDRTRSESDTSSGTTLISTHLLRRRADRRAARLSRLQRAAVGSFHVMPDRLSEEALEVEGVGLDDAIRVASLGRRLKRYGVIAEHPETRSLRSSGGRIRLGVTMEPGPAGPGRGGAC